jgi:hypothetical protein
MTALLRLLVDWRVCTDWYNAKKTHGSIGNMMNSVEE